jgi:hypothetical protein
MCLCRVMLIPSLYVDELIHGKVPMKELYLRVKSLFGNSVKGAGPGMVVWWDHLPSKSSILEYKLAYHRKYRRYVTSPHGKDLGFIIAK